MYERGGGRTEWQVDLATCDNHRARTLRKQYELSCETGRSSKVEWLEDGAAIKRRASYLQNASIDVGHATPQF